MTRSPCLRPAVVSVTASATHVMSMTPALDVDAIFHVTEWKAFRMPAWEVLHRSVKTPLLIDGRNVFDTDPVEAGFTLLQIGQ